MHPWHNERSLLAATVPMRRIGSVILIACGVTLAYAHAAYAAKAFSPTPREALAFVHSGAAGLALQLIDRGESVSGGVPEAWAQWERVRLDIYHARHDWRRIVQRVAKLPADTPADFHGWALLQAAEAEIELGNGAAARRALRDRVRILGTAADSAVREQVDLLMARSFVVDGRLADAADVLDVYRRRYARDPNADTLPLKRLQARLELRRGQPEQAYALLAGSHDASVQPLYWLGGLRAGKLLPAMVHRHAKDFASAEHPAVLRREALIVAAEAEQDMRHPAKRIALLERALTIPATAHEARPPFDLNAAVVWQSLEGLGQITGNAHRLIVGDDAAWFELAKSETHRPIVAQALLSMVAFHGFGAAARDRAHAAVAKLLLQQPDGEALLQQLYLHSKERFPSPRAIPQPVRSRLASIAYDNGDMALAASLFVNIDTPPAGADAGSWQLDRARALILGGKADAGIAALANLLHGGTKIAFNKLLPDLFALQAVGRDRAAGRFFMELLGRKPPPGIRQKLLYWLAESKAATGDYVSAARLYLRSATALSPTAMDPWAQTARYHAAGALAEAGLTDDARNIYTRLLGATSDPSRQAALRRDINALSLKTVENRTGER